MTDLRGVERAIQLDSARPSERAQELAGRVDVEYVRDAASAAETAVSRVLCELGV